MAGGATGVARQPVGSSERQERRQRRKKGTYGFVDREREWRKGLKIRVFLYGPWAVSGLDSLIGPFS